MACRGWRRRLVVFQQQPFPTDCVCKRRALLTRGVYFAPRNIYRKISLSSPRFTLGPSASQSCSLALSDPALLVLLTTCRRFLGKMGLVLGTRGFPIAGRLTCEVTRRQTNRQMHVTDTHVSSTGFSTLKPRMFVDFRRNTAWEAMAFIDFECQKCPGHIF